VSLVAHPRLRDPHAFGVIGVHRDEIREAAGHVVDAVHERIGEFVPVAGRCLHAADHRVHGTSLPIISARPHVGASWHPEVMAYDEELAARIHALLQSTGTLEPKRMFGGIGFMVDGHLTICVMSDGALLARVGADAVAGLSARGVGPMVMAGRPMTGWVRVESSLVDEDDALAEWVARCVGFVRSGSLPKRI